MNRLSYALALSVLMAGCSGSSSSPSGSSNSGGSTSGGTTTSTQTYSVPIMAGNEVSAVASSDRGISGTVTIKINATKDGNTVKSATVDYQVSASGFAAGTTITGAHIHTGGSAVNGGIFHNPGVSANDMPIANGSGSLTKNGLTLNAADAQAILANPANFYFNLHTSNSPDGAARGQLAAGGSPNDPGTGGGNPSPY